MKVTMLLADAAQAVEGKLFILGGGWSIAKQPAPTAIAIYIQVPWDRTNVRHHFRLELLDSDGASVEVPRSDGVLDTVEIDGDFEVGRPAGVKPGTPIDVPLAINIGPLALTTGERFEWRLSIDGESDEDWRLAFSTASSDTSPPGEDLAS